MIDRVYIIGAGASVPYGLPTLKTLTWDLCQTLSPSDRTILLAAIRECFGFDLAKPDDSPDFEELLNRLNPRAFYYLEDSGLDVSNFSRRNAAELALSGLRSFIRDKCADWGMRKGPLDVLIKALDETTLLVSFNWDVLLEYAILRAGRNYCYLPSKHSGDAVVLLKPHGSINWFALLDRELLTISGDSNLGVFGNDLKYYMCYVKEPLEPIKFEACSPMVEHALSRVPAIVPPVASKLLFVGGVPRDRFVDSGHTHAMKAIWKTLVDGLNQANEVVAIGYSLPGTDAASIEALRHFSSKATTKRARRIMLVNTNTATAERYRSILGVDVEIVCSDFNDFDPANL
ncbi:MAG: hypothetical protein H8D67_29685 [Deltaproteobacteria bacterium]|nr:hypothetical protein [Deltaproteobacteria bacterium]